MIPSRQAFAGADVLVTGHTGFKGGWLSLWLDALGARVHGLALDPPTRPSFHEAVGLGRVLASDRRGDIRDPATVADALAAARPRIVFHLAAQPLVRESYRDPAGSFATNVMGTVHVLEAVRRTPSVEAVVVATTDKVYENREWPHPYREPDRLGGRDPYSASKAACEIAAASLRASFFGAGGHPARIATARAGNVIGGGDFAADRLVPDCLRAFEAGEPVRLRYPGAVRPWQHVLEPLCGYLLLAERLLGPDGAEAAQAWNFGPDPEGDASVGAVAERLAALWGAEARVTKDDGEDHPHEAGLLRLDSTLARLRLGWRPRLALDAALARTVSWHRDFTAGADMEAASRAQIAAYAGGDA
ncbi:CDP-glucose 4,6-dehydratase [Salinarimonas sp.]|uniref:CDP-glucose 4,6-dehydratase n=1 Tax=Salinarimonas sp. TaxID=2766526 RepID=UPI0032D99155